MRKNLEIVFGSGGGEWSQSGQDNRVYSPEGLCPTLDLKASRRPLIVIYED